MSGRLTASAMARAHACPASFALPQVVSEQSHAASRGEWRHQYLQHVADGYDPSLLLEEIPADFREECAQIDTKAVPRGGKTEVAMAYDVVTGEARELPAVANRQYAVGATEIPGTADLVLWGGTETQDYPCVVDWKGSVYGTDQVAAAAQLDLYALMIARIQGVDEAGIWLGFVGDDGQITWKKRTLDWEDLATVAQRAKTAHEAIADRIIDRYETEGFGARDWTPDVATGSHCRYCPAFLHCPAKLQAVRGVIDAENTGLLTSREVAAAYLRAKDAEHWADVAKGAAREFVRLHGPADLGDGRDLRLDARGTLRITRAK